MAGVHPARDQSLLVADRRKGDVATLGRHHLPAARGIAHQQRYAEPGARTEHADRPRERRRGLAVQDLPVARAERRHGPGHGGEIVEDGESRQAECAAKFRGAERPRAVGQPDRIAGHRRGHRDRRARGSRTGRGEVVFGRVLQAGEIGAGQGTLLQQHRCRRRAIDQREACVGAADVGDEVEWRGRIAGSHVAHRVPPQCGPLSPTPLPPAERVCSATIAVAADNGCAAIEPLPPRWRGVGENGRTGLTRLPTARCRLLRRTSRARASGRTVRARRRAGCRPRPPAPARAPPIRRDPPSPRVRRSRRRS